jgi:hypothetical protein
VFFDSTYTAEYLTTHRDFFYLHVEQFVFFFFFFFVAWSGGFLLSRVLFLVILLVVYVFVVCISLRDDGR